MMMINLGNDDAVNDDDDNYDDDQPWEQAMMLITVMMINIDKDKEKYIRKEEDRRWNNTLEKGK